MSVMNEAGRSSPVRARLTPSRLTAFATEGKTQFLWDTEARGLGMRVTQHGAKAFVFQSKFRGSTIRTTIGDISVWTIDQARTEARRLRVLVDTGIDPREERKKQEAVAQSRTAAKKREAVKLGDAWDAYVKARKIDWSESSVTAHEQAMQAPGMPRKRSTKLSVAGPMWELREILLKDLNAEVLGRWVTRNKEKRPASTALSFRMLRAFLNWCSERPEYEDLAPPTAVLTKDVRRAIPKQKAKDDVLQREQLPLWFAAVQQLPDAAVSACLQTLLLTGARAGEIIRIRWDDVDFQWRTLAIGDKVEGNRNIPLSPFVAALLNALPRRNAYVFASSSPKTPDAPITWPHHSHDRALKAAGLPHLSIHGLRRSFGTLSEWVEMPVGVVAQIQGHKPSAIAEKHYRKRPLDLLRQWHDKLEAWILEQAGIDQPHPVSSAALRIVGGQE